MMYAVENLFGQKNHCPICQEPISTKDKFCSEECRKAYEKIPGEYEKGGKK